MLPSLPTKRCTSWNILEQTFSIGAHQHSPTGEFSLEVTHPSLISFLHLTLKPRHPHKSRAKSFSILNVFSFEIVTDTSDEFNRHTHAKEFSEKQENFQISRAVDVLVNRERRKGSARALVNKAAISFDFPGQRHINNIKNPNRDCHKKSTSHLLSVSDSFAFVLLLARRSFPLCAHRFSD